MSVMGMENKPVIPSRNLFRSFDPVNESKKTFDTEFNNFINESKKTFDTEFNNFINDVLKPLQENINVISDELNTEKNKSENVGLFLSNTLNSIENWFYDVMEPLYNLTDEKKGDIAYIGKLQKSALMRNLPVTSQ